MENARLGGMVLLGLHLVVTCGCGGGRQEAGRAQPATEAGAASTKRAGECSGSLTGPLTGSFTCIATANYYYEGSEMVGGRRSSLITILHNPYDPRHTRPTGVQSLGVNVEITGEPRPGTYTQADAGGSTSLSVIYDGGRSFDRMKGLALTLTEATLQNETDALGIKSRIYKVSGTFEATVADEEGEEVRFTASF